MGRILIKNAYIIDPSQGIEELSQLLIKDGKIAKIGKNITEQAETVIDARELCLAPGLVDMHVHFRDPGFTNKEDIITGSMAAAAGGFTSVVCMPNTKPVCDCKTVLDYINEQSKSADARIYPAAAITVSSMGQALTDFEMLKACGAIAVSDDGKPVKNAQLMLDALKLAKEKNITVISHCEDLDIIGKGIINKGAISNKLGVDGMDRASEDSITAREIVLARNADAHIHIAHVSTKGSVNIIRKAKNDGINVTCETAPHYMLLTDRELLNMDANYRMNPPLREESDRQAILEGIKDGTIDAIATDHAPHTASEKADFYKAPNGVIGLETSLAASITALVETNIITLSRLIEMMSTAPCRILGIKGGTLKVGENADIVIFDKNEKWRVDANTFKSKSRNTPFNGMTLTGKVKMTMLGGKITYCDKNKKDK